MSHACGICISLKLENEPQARPAIAPWLNGGHEAVRQIGAGPVNTISCTLETPTEISAKDLQKAICHPETWKRWGFLRGNERLILPKQRQVHRDLLLVAAAVPSGGPFLARPASPAVSAPNGDDDFLRHESPGAFRVLSPLAPCLTNDRFMRSEVEATVSSGCLFSEVRTRSFSSAPDNQVLKGGIL